MLSHIKILRVSYSYYTVITNAILLNNFLRCDCERQFTKSGKFVQQVTYLSGMGQASTLN